MDRKRRGRKYDLEERCLTFSKNIRYLCCNLRLSIASYEDSKQLIRSSGSVGANYIEANEALSRKDFVYRIKICRKEAKESCYWLKLVTPKPGFSNHKNKLIQEAVELMKIFGAIMHKSK